MVIKLYRFYCPLCDYVTEAETEEEMPSECPVCGEGSREWSYAKLMVKGKWENNHDAA